MKHVLAIIIVFLSGCRSATLNSALPAIREGIVGVDVILMTLLPPAAKPEIQLADATRIRAITALVGAQRWLSSVDTTVAQMPTADGYQFWIILHREDGSQEVIGVKDKELVRERYRSRISQKDLRKLGALCDLQIMEPVTVE